MKKVLIIIIILSFAGISSAQGFKLGLAGNAVFPTGEWSNLTSSGYGVDAYGVFDVVLFTLTVRAGYLSFGDYEQEFAGEKSTISMSAVPVMAGLRWEFGLPVGPLFFAGVEAGVHNFTTTVEVAGNTLPSASESKFAFGPNVGLEIAGFDLMAYYMIISDLNYWGLRLGWGIGI
jgi:opacity protein-like surface antigen